MPRRSAHLTVGIAGYDGDPNNVGAPAILKNSPKGTWYQRETPVVVWYRKEVSGVVGATSWVIPAGSGSASFTFEANCPAGATVGDAVYVTGAKVGGVAQVATVDITSLSSMPAVGVLTAKTIATDCTVQFAGEVGIYSGLTSGSMYMIDTDGTPTSTLPTSGSDHYIQRLGVATNSDSMLLSISPALTKRLA